MRRAARTDDNQTLMVKTLRTIPGVTVALRHDDILVGYKGKTYWYEVKNPAVVKKDGEYRSGAIKPSQAKLRETWTGHYKVVHSIGAILDELGINHIY